jgi:hypothetical protein
VDLLRHSAPLSRAEIRSQLRVNNQRLGNALTALEQQEQIIRTEYGWRLDASPSCDDLPCPLGTPS